MAEKPQLTVGYDGFRLDANVSDEEFQEQADFIVKKYNYDLQKISLLIMRDNPKAIFMKGLIGGVSDGTKLRESYGFMLDKNRIIYVVGCSIWFETELNSNKIIKVSTSRIVPGP